MDERLQERIAALNAALERHHANRARLFAKFMRMERERERAADAYFYADTVSLDEMLETRQGISSCLSPYQDLINPTASDEERRLFAEWQKKADMARHFVARNAPHCLKTLKLVLRNGARNRRQSILALMNSGEDTNAPG